MDAPINPRCQKTVQLMNSKDPVIMGILNVTPDSFSDGGQFNQLESAVNHALQMQAEGAAIIDIGGESTRPGAQSVDAAQEINRVIPVIEALRKRTDIPVSIDTSKPEVMRRAVEAGADMVNDVNALQAEGAVECCVEMNVPVCLMHMQGEPRSMQMNPEYKDVVIDVRRFLLERVRKCVEAGIAEDRIMIDPGFGFGKSLEHNLQLLSRLDELCELNFPVLVGLSRKSMLGAILGQKINKGASNNRPVNERLVASVTAAAIAYEKGSRFFRVHDVAETADALKLCAAVHRND
jgi:dihydropteroate synthase